MKPRFHSFMSGFLTCALVFALALSALAITSRMTIEVDPISIQVNGETFQPTDVNGKEVPVFAYQGTTYAPLRALAEAYGLEVGYDGEKNMATVQDPDNLPDTTTKVDVPDTGDKDNAQAPSYEEFKEMWEITQESEYLPVHANYNGSLEKAEFIAYWDKNAALFEDYCVRYIVELNSDNTGTQMYYYYDGQQCASAVEYKDENTHFVRYSLH